MTHCSLLFDALDKRLDKKMSIEEIAKELCADVDDPRGKVLRIIKVHKGKKWLIENADWLGYNVNFIRNVEGPVMYERSSEIMGKELPKIGDGSYTIGKLSMMLRENKDKVDDEKEGITIMGNLDEGMMHHLCLIDPYPGKEFRKVTVHSYIGAEYISSEKDEDTGTSASVVYIPDDWVDLAVNICFYPNSIIEKIRQILRGETNIEELDIEDIHRKYRKSEHPDWKWDIFGLKEDC